MSKIYYDSEVLRLYDGDKENFRVERGQKFPDDDGRMDDELTED